MLLSGRGKIHAGRRTVVVHAVEQAELSARLRAQGGRQLSGELRVRGLYSLRGRGSGRGLHSSRCLYGAAARGAGRVLHDIDALDRARVRHRGAGDGAGGLAIGEALAVVQGQRRLRVVLLAQRGPYRVALGDPIRGLGRLLDQGGLHLGAAAVAEQAADDAGDGDQVGLGEVRHRLPGQVVLAGEVVGGPDHRDVVVDSGQIGVRVRLELRAAGAVRGQRVDLRLEVGLGVGRGAPDVLLEAAVRGRAAGEGGQLGPPDVPEQVHDPQPVLGARVSGPELRLGPGLTVDVRDVGGVPQDRDAGLRRLGARDVGGRYSVGGVVVEVVDLRRRQPGVRVHQVVVLGQLIVVV